jgi:hypothetical protein
MAITTTTHGSRMLKRERVAEADDEAPELVKHTLQLPVKLWTEFGIRARRLAITKSEALRRAVWLFIFVSDCIEEGAEIRVHRPDGREERLVISPY